MTAKARGEGGFIIPKVVHALLGCLVWENRQINKDFSALPFSSFSFPQK
jgi:hypothetical protein